MSYSNRALCLATLVAFVRFGVRGSDTAGGQPSYVAITSDFLKISAQNLKRDLEDGAILMAEMHALQLHLAMLGALQEKAAASIHVMEQRVQPDKNQPQLTAALVPVADKLLQELNEPNFGQAKEYSEQLFAQVHKLHEQFPASRPKLPQEIRSTTATSKSPANWKRHCGKAT
jgi:hypothetical protein